MIKSQGSKNDMSSNNDRSWEELEATIARGTCIDYIQVGLDTYNQLSICLTASGSPSGQTLLYFNGVNITSDSQLPTLRHLCKLFAVEYDSRL